MKFLAEIEHTTTTFRNQLFLTLKIDNRKAVDNLKQELKKTSTYSINMKDIEDDRTLKQNRLLWKLIGEINDAITSRLAEKSGGYILDFGKMHIPSYRLDKAIDDAAKLKRQLMGG